MRRQIQFSGALFCCLLLGGCATSRSVLDIPTPVSEKITQANGKDVYINSTSDKRIFESNPASPEIPSLDPSEDQSDAIRTRSIARKRNGFGKALGDILLKEGLSVESLTKASIRQAFIEKGYRVIDTKTQITSDTYIVDAEISKFWSWINPGFFALTLSTEISTPLTVKSPDGVDKKTINVKASDSYQTGAEGNWVEVINKALRAYIDDLKTKLK